MVMKKLAQKTIESRIKALIASSKFLFDKKYYKTNKVSVAAWDSWAAEGKAGGCRICNEKYYIYGVFNKRHSSKLGQMWYSNAIVRKLCPECYKELERQCEYEFVKW